MMVCPNTKGHANDQYSLDGASQHEGIMRRTSTATMVCHNTKGHAKDQYCQS
jgi:hypothetical protein